MRKDQDPAIANILYEREMSSIHGWLTIPGLAFLLGTVTCGVSQKNYKVPEAPAIMSAYESTIETKDKLLSKIRTLERENSFYIPQGLEKEFSEALESSTKEESKLENLAQSVGEEVVRLEARTDIKQYEEQMKWYEKQQRAFTKSSVSKCMYVCGLGALISFFYLRFVYKRSDRKLDELKNQE